MTSREAIPTKLIRYRGGVVCFRIPAEWSELHGSDDGGEFYPDTADGRTLRVQVTTARAPGVVTPETAAAFATASNRGAVLLHLPTGDVCIRATDHYEEDGQAVVMHVWKLYNAVPPGHLRVVLFTYTVLASLDSAAEIVDEVAVLDREILNATFAREIAATPRR